MVLALGLPAQFEHRDFLVTLTFGVVVLSILVQGTTMGWLLRRVGVARESSERGEHERLLAVIESSRAALAEIERLDAQKGHVDDVVAELRAGYVDRITRAERDAVSLEKKGLAEEDRAVATRRALLAEKDALARAFRSGRLAEHTYEALVAEVDARLFDVDAYCDDPVEVGSRLGG
jgi:CPA1 family monovalent cation:H+ antiporter